MVWFRETRQYIHLGQVGCGVFNLGSLILSKKGNDLQGYTCILLFDIVWCLQKLGIILEKKVNSDWKWMSLYKWLFYNHFWPFLALCICIFHKTEVQTVILRCWMGLCLVWLKSYAANTKKNKKKRKKCEKHITKPQNNRKQIYLRFVS